MFCTCLCVSASDIRLLPYKNLKESIKITVSADSLWTKKVKRKNDNYYVKNDGVLISSVNDNIFDTNCSYLFINKGRLLGYSESELKFYEFLLDSERNIQKQELTLKDIAVLFKDFRIILISDFSKTTNVFKFNKKRYNEKIIIVNDTDKIFENYEFTTDNAKFKKYQINNAIKIKKKGMIQFSSSGENTKDLPWFILLVR